MPRNQFLYRWQGVFAGLHHVVPGSPMNMNVDKTGRQDAVAEINDLAVCWNLPLLATPKVEQGAIFYQKKGSLDAIDWSEQRGSRDCDHGIGLKNAPSFYRNRFA